MKMDADARDNRQKSNVLSAINMKSYLKEKIPKPSRKATKKNRIVIVPLSKQISEAVEERDDKLMNENDVASSAVFSYDDGDNMSIASFHTAKSVDRSVRTNNKPSNSQLYLGAKEDKSSTTQIYILLLELKTKKFEINQLDLPGTTSSLITVGDILGLIPTKAWDLVLAQQKYRGLCRPTDGIEMTNLSSYAMNDNGEYRIQSGEILIPIPECYSGNECLHASQHILKLPAVANIIQRFNSTAFMKNKGDKKMSNTMCLDKVDEVTLPSFTSSTFENSINNSQQCSDKSLVVFHKEKQPDIKSLLQDPWQIYTRYFCTRYTKMICNTRSARIISKVITNLILCYVFRKIAFNILSDTSSTSIVGYFEVLIFFSFLVWIQKKDRQKVKRKLVYGQ